MSSNFNVAVVDDDPLIHEIVRSILEPDCSVSGFETAEACAIQLETEAPDMILLDVGLPGMNGYDFCRVIKDDPVLGRIPITFVSSHDTIEARLEGYDSGGEDFIVKPFAPDEVLRKVKVARGIIQRKRALQEQADAAEYLSTLALASMDEAGMVLQFMSKLISWDTEQEVAEGLIELLHRYRLEGVVQVRVGQRVLTLGPSGPNIPLEISVLDHVRTLGRIFEFKTRGVHNFERVTLLVNNLPLNDPELCGRLRDNLSVAAQGADAKLRAIEIEDANRRSQAGILAVLGEIRESVGMLGQAHEMNRQESSTIINGLQDTLVKSFVTLGLTSDQERFLEGLVHRHMEQLLELLERGTEMQKTLTDVSGRLEALSRP